jgi:hypothetical protein
VTYKSGAQLRAEKVGYRVVACPEGYVIEHENLPVPRDPITDTRIVFDTQHQAWLAAWMFLLGLNAERQHELRPAVP